LEVAALLGVRGFGERERVKAGDKGIFRPLYGHQLWGRIAEVFMKVGHRKKCAV